MIVTKQSIVLSHFEACRSMGARAARAGAPLSDNPFDPRGRGHAEWSAGHNEARAAILQREKL